MAGKMTPEERRAAEVERAERLQKIVALRKAGLTLERIGAEVGLNKANVSRALKKAMRDLYAEDLEEHRQVELARLEDAYRKVYPLAVQGQLGAVDRLIRLSESKRKLLGLDAPSRVEVGVTDVDLDAAAAEVMAVAVAQAQGKSHGGTGDGETTD